MRTLFLCLFLVATNTRADVINGIYAVVNDAVITYQEVELAILPVAQMLANRHRSQPEVFEQQLQQARTAKVEELVQRHLVLHEFKTGPYQLPESIIDDSIRARIKEGYSDRATLTKTLQARGMTFESYRKQVREDFIFQALSNAKISREKIVISPTKIETYYNEHQDEFNVSDQVTLRQIVFNKSADNPEAARKLADEVLAKLKEGASFTDMAGIYSEAKDKGAEKTFLKKEMRKELAEAAFALKPGQISAVIDLPGEGDLSGAYCLLQVVEIKPSHIKPLTEAREEIEKILNQQEQNRLREQWFDRLKKKSFVRYF